MSDASALSAYASMGEISFPRGIICHPNQGTRVRVSPAYGVRAVVSMADDGGPHGGPGGRARAGC